MSVKMLHILLILNAVLYRYYIQFVLTDKVDFQFGVVAVIENRSVYGGGGLAHHVVLGKCALWFLHFVFCDENGFWRGGHGSKQAAVKEKQLEVCNVCIVFQRHLSYWTFVHSSHFSYRTCFLDSLCVGCCGSVDSSCVCCNAQWGYCRDKVKSSHVCFVLVWMKCFRLQMYKKKRYLPTDSCFFCLSVSLSETRKYSRSPFGWLYFSVKSVLKGIYTFPIRKRSIASSGAKLCFSYRRLSWGIFAFTYFNGLEMQIW